ncbi:class II D-tagatose-bisphosphate aldolase, non-catalytic subunit [uncultured Ruegeria sp.]|uniref:class II D-tagatose-bisphosphate aldolase, non-catalytic subunit n=1 Tax=uncultured Ruegeria sp. TaxID=259304 RepID=UPI00261E4F97|nr:class II D-tagatose-bisphosphate aldolase, non-catalytic subunit [uncultured Ruegeria sp.]
MSFFADLNARNRGSEPVAIPSVCSAQPDVLRASLLLAQELQRPVLIEATSNQVNQFGGYTGMQPADFIRFVNDIAQQADIDPALFHFGGDHLGPQAWRSEPADRAMAKAEDLMHAYVQAGFTKIHLDCSEGCAGEPAQVDDQTSATRAAHLAAVCEAAAPDPERLSYVIGTEVPPPGGARTDEEGQGITPTDPAHARKTLDTHLAAFKAAGVAQAWPRVIGLVVQPGLEFSATHIDHFDRSASDHLSQALSGVPHICFEAHSTDYQHPEVYPDLAARHFSVLKVGPALTFAYRQALYSLDHLRALLLKDGTNLMKQMEQVMLDQPGYWQKHYAGTPVELRLQRHFGYADRIRYYWPDAKVQQAVAALFSALGPKRPPAPVLEQCFDTQVISRAEALGEDWAKALVLAQVHQALRPYFF